MRRSEEDSGEDRHQDHVEDSEDDLRSAEGSSREDNFSEARASILSYDLHGGKEVRAASSEDLRSDLRSDEGSDWACE